MKRIVNFRPVVILTLSYISGLVSFYLAIKTYYILAVLLFCLPLVAAFIFLLPLKIRSVKMFAFCAACFLLSGAALVNVSLRYLPYVPKENISGECVVTARVAEVDSRNGYYNYVFDNASFKIDGKQYKNEKLTLYSSAEYDVGCVLTFDATVSVMPPDENGSAIGNLVSGIRFKATADLYSAKQEGIKLGLFEKIRLRLTEIVYENMDEGPASFAAAMLFGADEKVDRMTLANIRDAGLGHLFAVSGLHVGFVSGAIYFLLKLLKTGKYPTMVLSVAATFFYCGICGFSPSALRAFITFTFYIAFKTFGLKNDILNSTFTSAAILLVIKPQFVFSLSFILSYAAAISIAVLSAPIESALYFLPLGVAESASVMLSVQAGLLPLSVLFFGYATPAAIPLNLLFVPIVTPLFVLTAVGVLLSTFTGLGSYILFLPDKIIGFFLNAFSAIDFGATTVAAVTTPILVIIYYCALIFASDLFNFSYKVKLPVYFSAFAVCILFSQLFLAGIL